MPDSPVSGARPERDPAMQPCPFCGHAESSVRKLLRDGYEKFKDDPDAYAYTIACHGCASEGGWAKSESGARRNWNMRAVRAPEAGGATTDEPWFGCFTGDCPHEKQAECDVAIRDEFARMERIVHRVESRADRSDPSEGMAACGKGSRAGGEHTVYCNKGFGHTDEHCARLDGDQCTWPNTDATRPSTVSGSGALSPCEHCSGCGWLERDGLWRRCRVCWRASADSCTPPDAVSGSGTQPWHPRWTEEVRSALSLINQCADNVVANASDGPRLWSALCRIVAILQERMPEDAYRSLGDSAPPDAGEARAGDEITPEWCMETFYRLNPGATTTLPRVPSLYLLDFARAVLASRSLPDPEGSGTDGMALIAAERKRQGEAEGWTPEHDDEHTRAEMALAAACYALPDDKRTYLPRVVEVSENGGRDRRAWLPQHWPWLANWWKPTPDDRVRELTKAGALIAAEIDRLQRATLRPDAGASDA